MIKLTVIFPIIFCVILGTLLLIGLVEMVRERVTR